MRVSRLIAMASVATLACAVTLWAQSATTQPSGEQNKSAAPAKKAATTQPQAQQVLDRLMRQAPPTTPLKAMPAPQSIRKPKPQPSVAPIKGSRDQRLMPEGTYVSDRRGRLVKQGSDWLLAFESDGKVLADPPILLLPNRWLEKMETDVTASPDAMIFRVSGEVTSYRGRNYLLLRKVLIERRAGAIQPDAQ